MVDLNYILQSEMKIRVLASRFSFFHEVSVFNNGSYQPGKALTLILIVLEIPGKSEISRCSNFLVIKLSEELGCKVKIFGIGKKPLSSASLSVCKLFKIESLDGSFMKERNQEERFYAGWLRDAHHNLEKNAAMKIETVEAEEAETKRLKY